MLAGNECSRVVGDIKMSRPVGYKVSEATKEKIRIATKKRFTDPAAREKTSKGMRKFFADHPDSRKDPAYLAKITGTASANWRPDSIYVRYPSVFNQTLRDEILERDRHLCQDCGAEEKNNRRHDVHHIDEDIECSDKFNLISLCRSCHRYFHEGKTVNKEDMRFNFLCILVGAPMANVMCNMN